MGASERSVGAGPAAASAAAGERMSAERPLSDDAHLYRGIFENAIWGIFQTTPEGYYLTANPALARIYGYASADEMLSSLTDIGRQLYVDRSRRDEFIRLMKRNGALAGFESQVYRRDGAIIWISESCREVRDRTGRLLYYEGTVEDITARKRVEMELRAAKEEAEAASQAKSDFLAHMSHELRTPLNAVLGFAEVLKNELFGPLGDGRYRDYSHDIYNSGKHLLDVINDILDLAKIEAGHLQLNETHADLREIMAACERLVAETARTRHIKLDMAVPETSLMLRADVVQLRQILLNLLSNALKFTASGNRVGCAATRAPDGGMLIEVTDTGIGMTPEEVIMALQPFQQIENVFTRRYEGTGLGLPLTKALVELHGGSLVLDSAPGRGTTARVWLPASRIVDVATDAV
jgi:PAS domain S-box-containing protein